MTQLGTDLLNSVQKSFAGYLMRDKDLKRIANRVRDGTDYEDANEYAVRVGELLAKSIDDNTQSLAYMSEEVARELLTPLLSETHDLVAGASAQVQKNMNNAAGIGLEALEPDLDTNRIDGLVNKVASYDTYDEARWVMHDPVVNYHQAIVDQAIRKNASAHTKAGFDAVIIRKTEAHKTITGRKIIRGKAYPYKYTVPCKWCAGLEGVYRYKDVSNTGNDVFRRHEACRCIIIYKDANKTINVRTQHEWTGEDVSNIIAKIGRAESEQEAKADTVNVAKDQTPQTGLRIPDIQEPKRPRRSDFADTEKYEAAKNVYMAEREKYKSIEEEFISSHLSDRRISIAEFEKWCEEQNIVIDKDMTSVDERALALLQSRWQKLSEEFPIVENMRYKVQDTFGANRAAAYFGFENTGEYVAQASGGFYYGEIARNYENMLADRFYGVTTGGLVKGDGTMYALVDHEFGHNVQGAIRTALTEYDPRYDGVPTNESTARRLAFEKDIRDSLYGKQGMSEYATTNTEELFAEGFCAWYGGEKTEFANAMGELLSRWMIE